MNLYKVKTKAFSAYVLSDSMDEAYLMVKNWISEKNYGFIGDGDLVSVELLATSEFNSLPRSGEGRDVIFLGEPSKQA